jgi:four helix bundle protein
MHNFKELKIWSKALELSVRVYKITALLPKDDRFGLISQIKRSAVSIPSNIAEGAGRNSDKEFIYFLSVANGSAYELQTQLLISNKLNFLKDEVLESMLIELDEIQKMNYNFQKSLKKNSITTHEKSKKKETIEYIKSKL